MACGENPKRVYGNRNQMPDTRLGIGWKFREMFHAASVLRAEQKVYICLIIFLSYCSLQSHESFFTL